jgi:hypothetical protein
MAIKLVKVLQTCKIDLKSNLISGQAGTSACIPTRLGQQQRRHIKFASCVCQLNNRDYGIPKFSLKKMSLYSSESVELGRGVTLSYCILGGIRNMVRILLRLMACDMMVTASYHASVVVRSRANNGLTRIAFMDHRLAS